MFCANGGVGQLSTHQFFAAASHLRACKIWIGWVGESSTTHPQDVLVHHVTVIAIR